MEKKNLPTDAPTEGSPIKRPYRGGKVSLPVLFFPPNKFWGKPGSLGINLIGGLIFGIGFALLGYCPGTIAGAMGQGSVDAITGGVIGILLGSGIFAHLYAKIKKPILTKGTFAYDTIPELLKVNPWVVVIPVVFILAFILWLIEYPGA